MHTASTCPALPAEQHDAHGGPRGEEGQAGRQVAHAAGHAQQEQRADEGRPLNPDSLALLLVPRLLPILFLVLVLSLSVCVSLVGRRAESGEHLRRLQEGGDGRVRDEEAPQVPGQLQDLRAVRGEQPATDTTRQDTAERAEAERKMSAIAAEGKETWLGR